MRGIPAIASVACVLGALCLARQLEGSEARSHAGAGLTKEEVGATIQLHSGDIQACQRQALGSDPQAHGLLKVEFMIGANGRVLRISSVRRSASVGSILAHCVIQRLFSWTFPRPPRGLRVTVSYPFLFGYITPFGAPAGFPAFEASRPAPTAAQVYQRFQGGVFGLTTRIRGVAESASHGAAFVVNPSGILATSYHVVAPAAIEPEKYELILQLPAGPTRATIAGIDLANDLALIAVPATFAVALPVAPLGREVAYGERLFSLGLSQDLANSIVEGNFNGYLPAQRGRVLVASSRLNPGMSGGPTVDAYGEVIGVNPALGLQSRSSSLLSDAQALIELYRSSVGPAGVLAGGLGRVPASGPAPDWRSEVERQARWMESGLLESLGDPKAVLVRMGGLRYGNLPPGSRCGRDRNGDPDSPVPLDRMSCESLTLATTDGREPVSRIRVLLLGLGASRSRARRELFSDARVNRAGKRLFTDALRPGEFTSPDCDERVVENRNGVRVRVGFCTARFRRFGHLYRMLAKIGIYTGVSNQDLALFEFSGFSESGISRLVDYYVNSIQLSAVAKGPGL